MTARGSSDLRGSPRRSPRHPAGRWRRPGRRWGDPAAGPGEARTSASSASGRARPARPAVRSRGAARGSSA